MNLQGQPFFEALLALGPRWTSWKMRGENAAFVG